MFGVGAYVVGTSRVSFPTVYLLLSGSGFLGSGFGFGCGFGLGFEFLVCRW